MTESEERAALLPCPFCGAALTPNDNPADLYVRRYGTHHMHPATPTCCHLDGHEVTPSEVDAWNRRASSPPVPQQGAEAVAFMYQHDETGRVGFVDAQQVEWGFFANNPRLHLIGPLHTAPPLEARLRDVKTNQEIDAMVREMKQPSDEQIDEALEAWFAGAEPPVGADMQSDRTRMRAAIAALASVEKMKGEGA